MPVAEPRSPWVQGLPWALEPLLLGKASGGLHLTPDHRGVGARVEGVGKAFTPPSEPENFRFLKKERPVARPCSSPVCEMNQGDTDCDIPPLQEAKKKKVCAQQIKTGCVLPPGRGCCRGSSLASSRRSGRVREPRVPSGGPRPGLRSQGSECVFPSLGRVDSPGISIWHLQPREPPLSPLQPAGWGGLSSSAFDPQLCPAPQDTARSLSPLALEVSGGGQGGLPHGAAGRTGRPPPGPAPSPPHAPDACPCRPSLPSTCRSQGPPLRVPAFLGL